MKKLIQFSLPFSLSALSISSVGNAAEPLFRHVLACYDDGGVSNYELMSRFSPSALMVSDGTGTGTAIASDARTANASLGTISEASDSFTISFTTSQMRLSNGKYYTVPSSFSFTRLAFSYGSRSQSALSPGWNYIFATYDATSSQIVLGYQTTLTPPSVPHRYVGAVYLQLAATCASDPVGDPDQCSSTPACLATDTCATSGYGRYVGVPLTRIGNKYLYSINAQIGTCASGACPIQNVSAFALNERILATGGTSNSTIDAGPLTRSLHPEQSGELPVVNHSISVSSDTYTNNTLVLKGHDEDSSLYE